MKLDKPIRIFLRYFFHPRVFIFILIGTAVIFLTFLTNKNAVEIAISGIASVFIGIGVNNFSAFETHLKDEQQIKSKMGHTLMLMSLVQDKVKQLNKDSISNGWDKARDQLTEAEQLIHACIQLLAENSSRK